MKKIKLFSILALRTDGNAADHNYSNSQRASQLQYGERGNRFIQLYCIWILSIHR